MIIAITFDQIASIFAAGGLVGAIISAIAVLRITRK